MTRTRIIAIAMPALFFLLGIGRDAQATVLNDCPCASWPENTCSVSQLTIAMNNPNPAGNYGKSDLNSASITFTFDKSYEIGCFANGYDVWVRDAGAGVRVTQITPTASSSRNGAAVDFDPMRGQPFDSRDVSGGVNANYDASKNVSLPVVLDASAKGRAVSLTKFVSAQSSVTGPNGSFVKFGYTLTALPSKPVNNGSDSFRPPWLGTEKPMFSTTDIRWELIPNMSHSGFSVGGQDDLQTDADKFLRWCRTTAYDIEGQDGFAFQHPLFNLNEYGVDNHSKYLLCPMSALTTYYGAASSPSELEKDLIIASIQQGIDVYWAVKQGPGFWANAGYSASRLFTPAFAAVMLDQPEMMSGMYNRFEVRIGNTGILGNQFGADGHIYVSPRNGGTVLWGEGLQGDPIHTESPYAQNPYEAYNLSWNHSSRDPAGYIDGGRTPGGDYQICCSTSGFQAVVTASYMIPEVANLIIGKPPAPGVLNGGKKIFDYVERYMTFGVWANPDPCSRAGGDNGGFDCQPGSGRFLSVHGTQKGDVLHGLQIARDVYNKYASCFRTLTTNAAGQPALGRITASCAGQVGSSDSSPPPPGPLPAPFLLE